MATLQSNELRKGTVFKLGSENLLVLDYDHNKRGRGQATIKVKVKNIETGAITEKTFTNSERVETADLEKKSARYLYSDKVSLHFMSTADYAQFSISLTGLEREKNYLKEGTKVVALFLEDKIIGIELPKAVDLKISETSDAVAGDTSSSAMKDAILETGYKVQVPLFMKEGQSVRINTESGAYTGRS